MIFNGFFLCRNGLFYAQELFFACHTISNGNILYWNSLFFFFLSFLLHESCYLPDFWWFCSHSSILFYARDLYSAPCMAFDYTDQHKSYFLLFTWLLITLFTKEIAFLCTRVVFCSLYDFWWPCLFRNNPFCTKEFFFSSLYMSFNDVDFYSNSTLYTTFHSFFSLKNSLLFAGEAVLCSLHIFYWPWSSKK